MILDTFLIFFAFNLRKQNIIYFSFIFLTQNFVLSVQLLLSRTVSFSTLYKRWLHNGCSSVALAFGLSPPSYLAPPNSHIQK